MRVDRAYNLGDLRALARRRLPLPIFDYIDGGADDEQSVAGNMAAFAKYDLLQDVLVDVASVRTEATVLGGPAQWPLLLGPTGLTRMFHPLAEIAVSRAAAAQGVPYVLSTMGTTSIETFAVSSESARAFQIYIFRDRQLTDDFVVRCKSAGIGALVLTVDTPVAGNRERDKRNGLSLPPQLSLGSILSFMIKPGWSIPALLSTPFELVNVSHRADGLKSGSTSLFDYINSQFDRSVTWADVERLAALWNGPLLIKGVMTPTDAIRAKRAGATGVILSNHGGRQLDGAAAPVDQVARVADAVGGSMEIICDGGIRRGTDMIKALAMGATACSIGRPYLYGLAAGGEAGVARALQLLREEFERGLVLLGVNDVAKLNSSHVRDKQFSVPNIHENGQYVDRSYYSSVRRTV